MRLIIFLAAVGLTSASSKQKNKKIAICHFRIDFFARWIKYSVLGPKAGLSNGKKMTPLAPECRFSVFCEGRRLLANSLFLEGVFLAKVRERAACLLVGWLHFKTLLPYFVWGAEGKKCGRPVLKYACLEQEKTDLFICHLYYSGNRGEGESNSEFP